MPLQEPVKESILPDLSELSAPKRERLPDTRHSVTHKFSVCGHEGYITVGLYDDGRPGELYIRVAKEGSTLRGLLDCVGIVTSMSLQYGVPVEALVRKLEHQKFEPAGSTHNPELREASSIVDYIFRWLGLRFSEEYRQEHAARKENAQN